MAFYGAFKCLMSTNHAVYSEEWMLELEHHLPEEISRESLSLALPQELPWLHEHRPQKGKEKKERKKKRLILFISLWQLKQILI